MLLSTLLTLFSTLAANAAESRSSISSIIEERKEKLKQNDLDKEVTDIKLRANSGAKSLFSSSVSFTYSGASVRKPGDDERPNVGNSTNPEPVSLYGSFGLRYRMNKNESVYLATGLMRERPFHKREDEQLEVFDPRLGYNRTFAVDDMQVSTGALLYVTTMEYTRMMGQVGTLAYFLNTMSTIRQSRFSGGLSFLASVSAFDISEDEPMRNSRRFKTYGEAQKDYGATLSPTLQYNRTGRVNAYTTLSLLSFSHYRARPSFDFDRGIITQTLGLGVAIVRDFYISPYFSFEPEDIRADKTTVNLTASINL